MNPNVYKHRPKKSVRQASVMESLAGLAKEALGARMNSAIALAFVLFAAGSVAGMAAVANSEMSQGSEPALTHTVAFKPATKAVSRVLGATTSTLPKNVGVYYWDSTHVFPQAQAVSNALEIGDQLGMNTIRITISSRTIYDYSSNGQCLPNYSLKNMADAFFKPVFLDPQYSTVIINTYDAASNPTTDCTNITQKYFDPNFDNANAAAISQEYTDLANYLKQYTNKTFILMTDQGDLHIWGYNPVYNATSSILSRYPQAYQTDSSGKVIGGNMLGFINWMKLRYSGVKASGATNVLSGIEFDDLHLTSGCPGFPQYDPTNTTNPCLKDVLSDVLPVTPHDVTSYSAYESINISPAQFSADIDAILKMPGVNNFIIGEFGFPNSDSQAATKTQQVLNIVAQKGLTTAVVWNLLDPTNGYGTFDSSSYSVTPTGKIMEAAGPNLRINQPILINGTIYLVSPTGLYGFPNLSVLTSWGFSVSQVLAPNAAELALSQIGVVPTKSPNCTFPLDQINNTCSNFTPLVKQAPSVVISSVQGYDATTGAYTSTVASNKYAILYGTFAASGNTVLVNGQYASITYQSATQINALLGTLSGSTASIVVSNGSGTSTAYSAPIAGSMVPNITSVQGYDPAAAVYSSSITAGKYAIIYGTFAGTGDTVSVNGVPYTPSYDSANQLNVLLNQTIPTQTTNSITVTNSNGTSNSFTVTISSLQQTPVISSAQGYDATTGSYSTGISSNKYLILYGTFAASGNTVTVNGQAATVSYQSPTQLNVLLGTLTGSTASIIVTNAGGSSQAYNMNVVVQVSKPVISAAQGFDPATSMYSATLTSNKYLILYGVFAASGNSVSINGQAATVTYQSTSQLNILLGTLSGSTASIIVTNTAGASVPYSVNVAVSASNPVISSAQGFDPATSAYSASIASGKYLIIYGTFAGSSDTVKVNGASQTVTYDSPTQLNVLLGTLSGTSASVVVTNATGPSNSYTVPVAGASSGTATTTATSNLPVISSMQGYAGGVYSTTISSSQYLIIYGTFAGSSDTVKVNGASQTVTYDSPTQLNVLLGTLSGTSASVVVTNNNGSSSAGNITIK